MNNVKLNLIIALGAIMLLAPVARAEEGETTLPKTVFSDFFAKNDIQIAAGGTMDYFNRYVWRGQYLDRDNVIQPGFTLAAKGFTVGYWGSWDLENNDSLSSDESDYYVAYSYTFSPLTITAGHTWYGFPEAHTSSKEFYVTVAWATFLTPTLSFFHDYEDGSKLNTDGSGNYWSLGLNHSIPLCEKYGVTLELATTFGYNDGQWLSGQGTHITPTVGIKIPITPNLTMTPTFGYNAPFGDLKDENVGNQEDSIFGGVKVAYTN